MLHKYTLTFILITVCATMAATLPVPNEALPDLSDKAVAVDLVNTWIDGFDPKEGLVIHETSAVFKKVDNSHVYAYERVAEGSDIPDVMIHIVFGDDITAASTFADVAASFKRIALDRLATPGLGLDQFWVVSPRLPYSSFSDGVNITSYNNGAVTIEVVAEAFAVFGERKGHEVIADGMLPEDDYFRVRRSFPLRLTLEAKFDM